MLNAINTKLLIAIAVLLAAIAGDLAYNAHEAHVAAVAAAAMEKRQADAELQRKKHSEALHRYQQSEPTTWGNASKALQK